MVKFKNLSTKANDLSFKYIQFTLNSKLSDLEDGDLIMKNLAN